MASSVTDKIKLYVFPGLASLLGLLIWTTVNDIKDDVASVKADLKLLMAQSNIDKTRIDNIEREMFKTSSAPLVPANQKVEYQQLVAILPDNKIKYIK